MGAVPVSAMATAAAGREDLRPYLAQVASQLDERLPEIVREMRDLLATSIGPLGGDPQLVEMLQASIEGNVSTICHVLGNDISLENLQPTTAAVEYAARLAQHDVPVSALTRAYYLGQSMFLRLGIDAVEKLPVRDDQRIELVRSVADVVHRYIDWILQYVSTVHEAERRRWWNARATMNVAAVIKILHGDVRTAPAFEAETGYALDQTHVAVIAWVDGVADDADQQRIEQTVRRIAAEAGTPQAPLSVAADRGTAWAWIATRASVAEVRAAAERVAAQWPRLRLAIGDAGVGVRGFVASHEAAASARLVALSTAQGRERAVVAHTDPGVVLLGLFAADPGAARSWAAGVLGPLAEPGEQAAALRATLAGYFANGENVMRTADALGLHRNTVRARISRCLDGRAEPYDSIEIALALRLFDAFPIDQLTARASSQQPQL